MYLLYFYFFYEIFKNRYNIVTALFLYSLLKGSMPIENVFQITMVKARKTDHQTHRERGRQRKTKKLNQWKQDRMKGAIDGYRQVIDNGGVP